MSDAPMFIEVENDGGNLYVYPRNLVETDYFYEEYCLRVKGDKDYHQGYEDGWKKAIDTLEQKLKRMEIK